MYDQWVINGLYDRCIIHEGQSFQTVKRKMVQDETQNAAY